VRLQTVPNSPWPVVLLHLGRFTRALNALDARLKPDLTPPARFCYISTMKALIQAGSSLSACGHAQAGGRVSVPLKSDFLSIHTGDHPADRSVRPGNQAFLLSAEGPHGKQYSKQR